VRTVLAGLVLVAVVAARPSRRDDSSPIRVAVVVIAASTTNNTVQKKLEAIAPVVQKSEPTLVGFQIVDELSQRVKVGDTGTFQLGGGEELKVRVDRGRSSKDGTLGLTVYPPGSGEIAYSCTSGKYVPFVTDVTTKTGEKILVAVMAKPVDRRKK
jgi:hypothetical protein